MWDYLDAHWNYFVKYTGNESLLQDYYDKKDSSAVRQMVREVWLQSTESDEVVVGLLTFYLEDLT